MAYSLISGTNAQRNLQVVLSLLSSKLGGGRFRVINIDAWPMFRIYFFFMCKAQRIDLSNFDVPFCDFLSDNGLISPSSSFFPDTPLFPSQPRELRRLKLLYLFKDKNGLMLLPDGRFFDKFFDSFTHEDLSAVEFIKWRLHGELPSELYFRAINDQIGYTLIPPTSGGAHKITLVNSDILLIKSVFRVFGIEVQDSFFVNFLKFFHGVFGFSAMVGAILDRIQPDVVFLRCWYSNDGLATCIAASKRNIPVVDLQHASGNLYHPAYSGWRNLSPEARSFLPARFWCWSDSDKQARSFMSSDKSMVDAFFNGGENSFQVFKSLTSATAHPRKVSSSATNQKIAVVPIGYATNTMPIFFLRYLETAPSYITWWFRKHPADANGYFDVFKSQVLSHGSSNVDFLSANNCSLYEALDHADLVVSYPSTVVFESIGLGIPTALLYEADSISTNLLTNASLLVRTYDAQSLDEFVKRAEKRQIGIPDKDTAVRKINLASLLHI